MLTKRNKNAALERDAGTAVKRPIATLQVLVETSPRWDLQRWNLGGAKCLKHENGDDFHRFSHDIPLWKRHKSSTYFNDFTKNCVLTRLFVICPPISLKKQETLKKTRKSQGLKTKRKTSSIDNYSCLCTSDPKRVSKMQVFKKHAKNHENTRCLTKTL